MTTNHPAHGPVSLDRLRQIRETLSKAAAQSDGGNLGYAMADAVKVIDGVIAAFGAEPVAWQWEYRDKRHVTNDQRRAKIVAADGEVLVQPLYTAPPVPVVDADDNFYSWFGREWEKYYQPNNYSLSAKKHLGAIAESAWFACRAAMLQAGNSPVIPDGWQLVPKEPTEAMNKAGWDAMNEHDAINPTYRAMLAAAPQQDVRLALEIGMSRYAGAMQKLVDSGD
ncbi:hypothetical protein [Citrobacter portucalensis]|uniref:hypothetical protein n=1 Tax=Citrobacter portucalensis TaxID=1639133 RepID=UPI001F1A5E96|nr:hypothetical protein [Citrobacter portucalensis]MCE9759215.1 hypothetical protein [Citrobacter portucalensis]